MPRYTSTMYRDMGAAAVKARRCLPAAIGRVVSERIMDLEITGWLGDQQLWNNLVAEVMALPDPEEQSWPS